MSAASRDKDDAKDSAETRLVLSGGEGYVDFRIGTWKISKHLRASERCFQNVQTQGCHSQGKISGK